MSMLAEPKRKQRWSLNPRGKAWLDDKNGFGQKMLEKMGWKYGKGLGSKEQGITESLKVSYKNDSRGMGYKDTEEWTAHEQNFSSFLENLNGTAEGVDVEVKVTSLEKKVKNIKARINYHKFTKAKDLSRYSEKDIANIFGKKSLKDNKNKVEVPEDFQKTVETSEDVSGDVLVNKGSMADYFKSKLHNFNNRGNDLKETESESENERMGFGFQQANTDTLGVSEEKRTNKRKYLESFLPHFQKGTEDSETIAEEKEKKKRKKNSTIGNFISYVYEDSEKIKTNCEELQADNTANETNDCDKNLSEKNDGFVKSKKKSKKLNVDSGGSKRKSEETLDKEETLDGISCQSQNETDCKNNLHTENTDKKRWKHKLKKLTNEHQEENGGISCNSCETLQEVATNTKAGKKQKKSKKSKGIDEKHQETTLNSYECPDKEIDECSEALRICDKKEKKLKSKQKKEEIQEHTVCFDSNNIVNSDHKEIEKIQIEEEVNSEKKQKKLKKSKKREENGIENAAFSDYINENEVVICENPVEETNSEQSDKKRKKSKKRKLEENSDKSGISNPAFDELNNSNSVSIVQDEFEETPRKKKKKKKKSKAEEEDRNNNGIDNPTFNITAKDVNTPQNQFELKIEVKKNTDGLVNPALNLSDPILDCDLMLNVVDTPVVSKKSVEKFALNSNVVKVNNVNKGRRKSVRFSDVLQEHIIPNDPTERINEYISNRNELFDINTMVIEEGLKEQMEKQGVVYENANNSSGQSYDSSDPTELNKRVVESSVKEELNRGLNSENRGFINNGFDIRSVDKINFFNDKFEVKSSPPTKNRGIDNKAFNKFRNQVEENVENISNKIEQYQAEVENDINESKTNRRIGGEWLVGDVGTQIDRNIKVEDGSKLSFKEMHFRTPVPHYWKGNNVSRAKKSYRHLIRGDITIAFKNSNLHEINGYAVKAINRTGLS